MKRNGIRMELWKYDKLWKKYNKRLKLRAFC